MYSFFIEIPPYSNGLLYFLSSLAQCSAAFVAFVAVFAVFRLQKNNELVQAVFELALECQLTQIKR